MGKTSIEINVGNKDPLSSIPRNTPEAARQLAIAGEDLRRLTVYERALFKIMLCQELRLNPLLNCIDYIESNGKLKPYINSLGVSQLRATYGISVKITSTTFGKINDQDFVQIKAVAMDAQGRSDEALAVVSLLDKYGKPLKGESVANAIMKCETKAKRRSTLSLVGVPWGNSGTIQKGDIVDPPLSDLDIEVNSEELPF